MLTYSGTHALILGGSSAIGRTIAKELLKHGITISCTASSRESACALQSDRPQVTVHQLAMHGTTEQTVQAFMQAVTAQHGSPAYLVDCMQSDLESFIAGGNPAEQSTYLHNNIATRALYLHHISRAMLAKRTGRCLFVSSTAAALPNAGQGFYAASKQAAEALYRNLGIELAARGITTCSLRLGYVDAGRGARYLQHAPEAANRSPIGRTITLTEVAATACFLLSDEAKAINATTITLDGGLTACK